MITRPVFSPRDLVLVVVLAFATAWALGLIR